MPVGRASRMEGSGIVDRIQVIEDVVEKVGFDSLRTERAGRGQRQPLLSVRRLFVVG